MLEKIKKDIVPPNPLLCSVKEKIESLLALQKRLHELYYSGETTLDIDEIKEENLKQNMKNFEYIRIQK
ncbi:MAG: hypothetical protein RI945_123, partial [Candidatus Parcubacteria bacterium]